MYICPKCRKSLKNIKHRDGQFWSCPECHGRMATVSMLRKHISGGFMNRLWQKTLKSKTEGGRGCPSCMGRMREVEIQTPMSLLALDVCRSCQFVWFDAAEYGMTPNIPLPNQSVEKPPVMPKKSPVSFKTKTEPKVDERVFDREGPDNPWKYIPGFLGMPVEYDSGDISSPPWLTWVLSFVMVVVAALTFRDLAGPVEDYGMIPERWARYGGLTFITSFFLHAGLAHLLGNLYFFVVFGDNVEDHLGKGKFLLLLLLATVAGDVIHILGDPSSAVPAVGASGGISGVLAYYAVKFPRARLGFMYILFVYIRWIRIPAFVLFGFWIVLQMFGAMAQVEGFSNVSYLAHLGGVGVGIIFALLQRDKA